MRQIQWKSPSNIALVKYWGKYGVQLPSNPSISFTLSECTTTTRLQWKDGRGKVSLRFNGEENAAFGARAEKYIRSIESYLPHLKGFDLAINSVNNFPHSAGIASSASAMSSLALCLCSLEQEISGVDIEENDFFRKASFLARLGSGSASRSVYGGFVSWGRAEQLKGSSDEYASPLPFEVHENFRELRNSILIVDDGPKAVSSSQGHKLMNTHPYAAERFSLARDSLLNLLHALKNGDKNAFVRIVENEALGLHGLMMSSEPGYILLKPGSLQIIEKIRHFRKDTGIMACFTLDAGPNVHLIYPSREAEAVHKLIDRELLVYCKANHRIDDHIGSGPQKI